MTTYKRDIALIQWCEKNKIHFVEHLQQGVFRGIKNRRDWLKKWDHLMNEPIQAVPLKKDILVCEREINKLEDKMNRVKLEVAPHPLRQVGGSEFALRYLNSFFKKRYQNYQKHISKPDLSRRSCSRLSPYLAFCNLSMRQVLQKTEYESAKGNKRFALKAFVSRLRWQSHFIQKFEMECSMESVSYTHLTLPTNREV